MSDLRVFLDISALIAAVLSRDGGARAVLTQGEMGLISVWVGRRVLQEADGVMQRKAPDLRSLLALSLSEAKVQIGPDPGQTDLILARAAIGYEPDAYVLAEALAAHADCLITHDEKHFLRSAYPMPLTCQIMDPCQFLAFQRARLEQASTEAKTASERRARIDLN